MKKIFSLFLVVLTALTTPIFLVCCQTEKQTNDPQPIKNIVELNENNYWKYVGVTYEMDETSAEKKSVSYEINGVLDFAFYEDVVFFFDVIYYTNGQPEEEYQSYTMRIACNAAGDAAFETTHLGLTNVTIGKWLGADGELVSLVNYNWKIHLNSVSGKVIYTI